MRISHRAREEAASRSKCSFRIVLEPMRFGRKERTRLREGASPCPGARPLTPGPQLYG
jgi:hypothetical protein